MISDHKSQNSGDLIAQFAIWLGEITVFSKDFLRECIERMEAQEITATASYSSSILFQKLAEILFIYAQLLEDFIEKPASDSQNRRVPELWLPYRLDASISHGWLSAEPS